MASAVYPLPMNEELARTVRQTALEAGMSRAEVMRQALRVGLPKVRAALRRTQGRLTCVEPLPTQRVRLLYAQKDDDRVQIGRLMAAQRIEVPA